jgi:hypothetical protein
MLLTLRFLWDALAQPAPIYGPPGRAVTSWYTEDPATPWQRGKAIGAKL